MCSQAPLVCDDQNPCTVDSCNSGTSTCVFQEKDCAVSNKCVEGFCNPKNGNCETAPKDCDDGNQCTNDSCDPAVGCLNQARDGACEDGDFCTVGDTCQAGVCKTGNPRVCDSDQCTQGFCDSSYGCRFSPRNEGLPCSDGSICTAGDKCIGGICIGSPTVSCDDGNPCTTDYCDPREGCVSTNNNNSCDDGLDCTKGDVCRAGACTGTPVVCEQDGNQCTDNVCVEGAGCTSVVLAGQPCDDGLGCTEPDTCDNNAVCAGLPKVCVSPNTCLVGECVEGRDCVFAVRDDGSPCSDGNACTSNDTCSGGTCKSGAAVDCRDGLSCTEDLCDQSTGCYQRLRENCSCREDNECVVKGSKTCCEYRFGDWGRECYYNCD